jgi:hypothetical protein
MSRASRLQEGDTLRHSSILALRTAEHEFAARELATSTASAINGPAWPPDRQLEIESPLEESTRLTNHQMSFDLS